MKIAELKQQCMTPKVVEVIFKLAALSSIFLVYHLCDVLMNLWQLCETKVSSVISFRWFLTDIALLTCLLLVPTRKYAFTRFAVTDVAWVCLRFHMLTCSIFVSACLCLLNRFGMQQLRIHAFLCFWKDIATPFLFQGIGVKSESFYRLISLLLKLIYARWNWCSMWLGTDWRCPESPRLGGCT